MRSQLYYTIFETDTHFEYHVSSEKQEVIDRRAMSRRIKKDHPEVEEVKNRWKNEVEFYRSIEI